MEHQAVSAVWARCMWHGKVSLCALCRSTVVCITLAEGTFNVLSKVETQSSWKTIRLLVCSSCSQLFNPLPCFVHLHHFTAALHTALTPLSAAFIPPLTPGVSSSPIQQDLSLFTEKPERCWTSEAPLNTHWPDPHLNHTQTNAHTQSKNTYSPTWVNSCGVCNGTTFVL